MTLQLQRLKGQRSRAASSGGSASSDYERRRQLSFAPVDVACATNGMASRFIPELLSPLV
jgi:hypothetical protein